ncbi:unnamed protein product [Cylicocyclus nassatus]|uniref:Nas2 N-terminal domain-containing protein n=1 Tax=Cylicocyclus nassatus TaxID=53992 RepID=A0AA36H3T2_CYLNA|nr:unnamed protein product [Cylicocyclus nassatus]
MGAKEQAKDLIAQRDKIDAEIEENFQVLKDNASTMDSPLVDKEGFPFSHIDVDSVRQARHNIICLRNDRKNLTEQIEKAIQDSHAEMRAEESDSKEAQKSDEQSDSNSREGGGETRVPEKAASPIVHRTSNKPFIKYGSLHAGNFKEMKEVSTTTAEHEGRKLRVTVLRNHRAARLEIFPKRWAGNGILGCGIVPISTNDII